MWKNNHDDSKQTLNAENESDTDESDTDKLPLAQFNLTVPNKSDNVQHTTKNEK